MCYTISSCRVGRVAFCATLGMINPTRHSGHCQKGAAESCTGVIHALQAGHFHGRIGKCELQVGHTHSLPSGGDDLGAECETGSLSVICSSPTAKANRVTFNAGRRKHNGGSRRIQVQIKRKLLRNAKTATAGRPQNTDCLPSTHRSPTGQCACWLMRSRVDRLQSTKCSAIIPLCVS